ncbi:MAG: hypothetical protein M3Q48_10460, partial [Actinomycetota bacterium]|nr:hypothetical protein [Actinomycetota bacterium]
VHVRFTNLVIELGVLLWIFLGSEFVLARYLGAAILIPVQGPTTVTTGHRRRGGSLGLASSAVVHGPTRSGAT